MAAGGSSLVANYLLASLLIVISHAANKPEPAPVSDTFQYAALAALRNVNCKSELIRIQIIVNITIQIMKII